MIALIVKINILTEHLPSTQANSKKKIKNISPPRIRAILLVDGQVVFLGVRRPTLRLIRLKMSEIILTGHKTQIITIPLFIWVDELDSVRLSLIRCTFQYPWCFVS